MLSIPSADRYIAARPTLVERAAFESSLGLFLAWGVAPDNLQTLLAVVLGVAIVVALVPPMMRGRLGGSDTIWPVTKRPADLRVTGPGIEPLPGVVRGGWLILAAAAVSVAGFIVWVIQRDSYDTFLFAAALWVVGSIAQAIAVYRAESAKIATHS